MQLLYHIRQYTMHMIYVRLCFMYFVVCYTKYHFTLLLHVVGPKQPKKLKLDCILQPQPNYGALRIRAIKLLKIIIWKHIKVQKAFYHVWMQKLGYLFFQWLFHVIFHTYALTRNHPNGTFIGVSANHFSFLP